MTDRVSNGASEQLSLRQKQYCYRESGSLRWLEIPASGVKMAYRNQHRFSIWTDDTILDGDSGDP